MNCHHRNKPVPTRLPCIEGRRMFERTTSSRDKYSLLDWSWMSWLICTPSYLRIFKRRKQDMQAKPVCIPWRQAQVYRKVFIAVKHELYWPYNNTKMQQLMCLPVASFTMSISFSWERTGPCLELKLLHCGNFVKSPESIQKYLYSFDQCGNRIAQRLWAFFAKV